MRRLLIVALVLVPFAACSPKSSDKPGPFSAQELAMSISDQEAKLLTEVAAHAFWQVPVRTAQVSGVVKKMQAQQDDAVFLLDDHFHLVVQHGGDAQGAPSERRIRVNLDDYTARLSRVRLLIELKAKLDAAEGLTR